ncbi:MAG: DUF3108 domain-containing protein [Bryobacteraceae bacterium]
MLPRTFRTAAGILALALCPAPLQPQAPAVRRYALPAREMLQYTVEWRLITAGRAQLDWAAATHEGEPGYQAKLHLESAGLVSKLFRVEDDYTTRLRADLCALSSYIKAEEGRRKRETTIRFDPEERKATYLEKDLVRNAVVASHDIDIPACVHDVVGGLYRLRTLRLEPGQSTQMPVSDGKKSVLARVEAQQREDVRTPAGEFKTVRYEAFLFNNVLYKRNAHLYVWLTDDDRKLPVQIRVRLQFTIGTITLQLSKVEKS